MDRLNNLHETAWMLGYNYSQGASPEQNAKCFISWTSEEDPNTRKQILEDCKHLLPKQHINAINKELRINNIINNDYLVFPLLTLDLTLLWLLAFAIGCK